MPHYILTFCVLLLLLGTTSCLQVTPGSSCASLCLDHSDGDSQDPAASSTNSSDISCFDSEYSSTTAGIKFQECLSCLQESKTVNGTENDVSWFLYNLRYTLDVCLFAFPKAQKSVSSPCDIDYGCAPLAESLKYDLLNPNNGSEFGYCTADNGSFKDPAVEACYQCFQASTDQIYMSNFLLALKAGCQQTPQPGTLLGLSGKLFSENPINITAPPSNGTAGTSNSNPAAMTNGTIAGIATGSSLLFLGGVGLFAIHHRREKRLARDQNSRMGSDYDPRIGSSAITAPNKGAFTSIESRPPVAMMSDYELKAQKAYTNNAEYYDVLEKEMSIRRANYTFDPRSGRLGSNGALPTHPAYVPGNISRSSSRTVTPIPPPAVKYHPPDSYALQQYLNAAEDAVSIHLPPPPATHPPSRTSNRSPSPADSATTRLIQVTSLSPPPPPPQPQHRNRVPSLSLPTVSRIKIPKKYSPPQIYVQSATPVDRQNGDMQISKPLIIHERRFQDRSAYGAPVATQTNLTSDTEIIEQYIAPPPLFREDMSVKTGDSSFYG
ncbi:uncharacterized protein F4807DRAFT_404363 [Annulohypoxylon truncatum]|uniref:uncharacterized protein n=1 Tax=Annulohypoxylon truncatum TaxID=327061 RepID=UPI0020088831|nr:uncharacterized protein F4807DRAFT_404363 [Annulohypoxylon truncatum]KAI1214731.1 hypothetical protein F4807DRAFT_404363 [Annulohypoxylon truncatum]